MHFTMKGSQNWPETAFLKLAICSLTLILGANFHLNFCKRETPSEVLEPQYLELFND